MGIWDKLRGELIDIIQWLDDSNNTLVHRFERYNNQIKYGAKLTVREGQAAVFVNEGKIADVFAPGMYTLETQNLPILSTLLGWKYGFNSPFVSEVYFVSTRQFTDLKWGTSNPVMLRDAEFGPVRLRAFGTYAMKVKDPAKLIREIVGTDGHFTTEEITEQLRNLIVSGFNDVIGQTKIPVLDLAGNATELSKFLTQRIGPEYEQYGLELTKLLVENISLPPAVEEALDKRTSMGVVGNLQAYTQFQTANSIPDAARNPGGLAAAGAGLGLGAAMAGAVGGAMQQNAATPAAPPPLPAQVAFFVAINGQQTGPFDVAGLQQQAMAGKLTRDTLVWRQGMPAWAPAYSVNELANVLGSVPPPVPPTR